MFATLNCKQEKTDSNIKKYNRVATEFLSQILSDEYYNCSYVIKPEMRNNVLEDIGNETLANEYKDFLIELLRISNEEDFDKIIDYSKEFDFDQSIVNNKVEIVDADKYRELRKIADSVFKYGNKDEKDNLFNQCPSIYSYRIFSKPVFDKKFETAIIFIELGGTCFPANPWIYKIKNGKWNPAE